MNRRTFLRSLTTVCGAAVVCPGELLKSPVKHLWMRGKDGAYIEGIVCKARQQGCTDSTLSWARYYMEINYIANPL